MSKFMFDNNSSENPAFICPNCGIKTAHKINVQTNMFAGEEEENIRIVKVKCFSCNQYSIFLETINHTIVDSKEELKKFSIAWGGIGRVVTNSRISILELLDQKLIYPDNPVGLPNPNPDMPDSVSVIYNEAASITNKSPRAAAALLRLALERLLEALGETHGNLNKRIGNLYGSVPADVTKIMDIIRITGNNGIHDGDIGVINIDGKDDKENVLVLFKFINHLTDLFITQPKILDDITNNFTPDQKSGIERRNNH